MKRKSARLARWLVLCVLATGLLAGALAQPAHAVDEVSRHASRIMVEPDGALEVTTTMTFEGGAPETLTQRFRTKEPLVDERAYALEVSDVTVTADGQPARLDLSDDDDHVIATISAPGANEIVLTYRVAGAATRTPDGQTLVKWDVLQGLSVGAREVEGEVIAPGQFTDFKCVAGAPGTQSACALAEGSPHDSLHPRFVDGPRGAGEIVGPRITFPANMVATNEQIHEYWTVGRAFSATGWPLAAALATLLIGAAVLFALHRRAGRDATPSGDPIEVARFDAVGAGEVEFRPGREVLPGEVGTVADERVDPIDITATVLDLAVHGHLRITELPRRSEFAPTDWYLTRLDSDLSGLRAYEKDLLDAVAPADGSEILVSTIGPTVAGAIAQIQSDLYDEVVEQGFFDRRPDDTRNVWNMAALIVLILGVVATGVLAAFTRFGLTGLALIAIGLGLAFVAQEMPARTAKGARLLAGLGQLRSQLLSQTTDQMPKGREYEELSEVLPYAIVLGGAERWLDAIVRSDDDETPDSTDLTWYHGPDNWHLQDLPDSLRNFITTMNGNLFAR